MRIFMPGNRENQKPKSEESKPTVGGIAYARLKSVTGNGIDENRLSCPMASFPSKGRASWPHGAEPVVPQDSDERTACEYNGFLAAYPM